MRRTCFSPRVTGPLEPGSADLPDFSDTRLVHVDLHHAKSQFLDGGKYLLGGKFLIGGLSHESDDSQLQLIIDPVNIKVG